MLINEIRQSFNDDIIYKMEKFLCNPDTYLEPFDGINAQKQQEALIAVRNLCMHKDEVKVCSLCHHTELVINEWVNDYLCLGCFNIRNNRARVEALLKN